jgi:hypothetical protein
MTVISDLESKFDLTFKELFDFYKTEVTFSVNLDEQVRPLAIRVGQLRSNFREGLIKFYNKNAYEAVELINSYIKG